jgi:anti-sigma factor RsiW
MTCDEVRGKLAPYVDSELPTDELAEFNTHLRSCASCAADALGLLQAKRTIRAAAMRYTPSPEFRLRMEQVISAKRRKSWLAIPFPNFVFAVTFAMVLIAAVSIWVSHSGRERELAEIADLHVTTLASTNPVDVISSDRHTVKPWFAGKLPFSFNLPELQNSEFTLIGGRVVYFQSSSGAQLLFTLRKHQLSVFIFKDEPREIPFLKGTVTATRLALHIESWSEGGLHYFIVSDAPASDVENLGALLKRAARS